MLRDNKVLENCETFFLQQVDGNEGITLIEEDKVVSEDNEVTETIKSYFETLLENLGINSRFMPEELVAEESVTDIIKKF